MRFSGNGAFSNFLRTSFETEDFMVACALKRFFLVSVALFYFASPVLADGTFGDTQVHAIPTFHSIGLYWAPGTDRGAVNVQFRPVSDPVSPWRQALPLWFDNRRADQATPAGQLTRGDQEYRGSIVDLEPGTQ